jgi:death-on-curing protein
MEEPRWVDENVVLAIHVMQLAEHGGIEGVRDEGLLSSALSQPKGRFFYGQDADIAAIAAAYAFALAKNHAFNDGNKRTAAVVCETFIRLNKFSLKATDEQLYVAILQLAEGTLDEEGFANWLREFLVASESI